MTHISNYQLAVIIPIYNAEQYLSNTLDCILQEEMENLHFYLVNDGSSDNSQSICNSYAECFPNITVISQDNAGPSAARNAALAKVKEEYVTFLDADDEIEPRTYRRNLEWLMAHPDTGILFFPIKKVHFDCSSTQDVNYDTEIILSMNNAFEKWCSGDKSITGYFGGKIFRSELFYGLTIKEDMRFAEDMFVLSDILSKAKNICLSPFGNYLYFERTNAATQTPWTKSKASDMGLAYFHRWEIANRLQISDSSIINSWRLALAEISAERRRFPDILNTEFQELKLNKPTLGKFLKMGYSIKRIAGIIWNLWQ